MSLAASSRTRLVMGNMEETWSPASKAAQQTETSPLAAHTPPPPTDVRLIFIFVAAGYKSDFHVFSTTRMDERQQEVVFLRRPRVPERAAIM